MAAARGINQLLKRTLHNQSAARRLKVGDKPLLTVSIFMQWEALALLLIGISVNQLKSLPEGSSALGLPVAAGAYLYTLFFVTCFCSSTYRWADTKNGGESSSTAQVKSLYVKNLPKTVTQEQLKKLFEHLGEVTKVVLPAAKAGHENRYGFVHFKERSMAMKALKDTERYELDGHLLDCSLANPLAEKKDDTTSVPKGGPLLPSYTPLGYGPMGAYNPLGNGLAGAYNPHVNGVAGAYGVLGAQAAQPMLYVPGAPLGSTMIPMVLPDGRLVYIPQPAGQQPVPMTSPPPQKGGRHNGDSGGGGSSSGGRRQRGDESGSSNNSRRGRHRPY